MTQRRDLRRPGQSGSGTGVLRRFAVLCRSMLIVIFLELFFHAFREMKHVLTGPGLEVMSD